EPRIRALLAEFPDMPSTVIMERVGWTRGKTVLFDRVQQLRPLFRPPDPVQRTDYLPGELAQCDLWFPPADVPGGFAQVARVPVLVSVSGPVWWLPAATMPSRWGSGLPCGQWRLIAGLGPAPWAMMWNNESAVGSCHGGPPQFAEAMQGFRGALGSKVIRCRP